MHINFTDHTKGSQKLSKFPLILTKIAKKAFLSVLRNYAVLMSVANVFEQRP